MVSLREEIANARRIVIKLGTSSLVNESGALDPAKIDRIVDAIENRIARGSQVIVVSSGAIAAGMGPLGLAARPRDLASKQAAASVGQIHLAQVWGRSFARYGRTVGQVLLTQADAGSRERARNAQRTIDRLRQIGAVPIVNENDTVATSEMRFGDNDRLSAIVATLISADALVLLSDVDALYGRNPAEPGATRIDEVRTGNDLTDVQAGDGGVFGTGGMAAKVSAARLAARGGVPVLLTATANIDAALGDAQVGTVFHTRPERKLNAWKFWALYAADAEGVLRLDAGAVDAVTRGGTSLLAVGITGIEGEFHAGDIVEILGPDSEAIGRGEVAYDAAELATMLGKHSEELAEHQRRAVVHADYLSNYASRL
ncbi:glutamate 5-kinase [Corynebacterium lujinxingii]|uniref:Glutamate 5-kinase n=1 Tax=Corynebacterium lujinxingii TaxID=2763010 RepID=A0A7H0JXN3_9CORY|nr:glutamate 5-kinase [Corynebacterium lujinxingii]MBC3177754.1 glutamate 5-kinase [Corynebacterium lujinxingii]NNO10001.1 glutamate 5-kinase [Corynebacterium lujinxingii]QNP89799.1 glutamate 5-kinase [Corynebacterium lujinxingii]